MKLERLPSEAEVAKRCADIVAALLQQKADARIVLPAGKTPTPLYRELVRRDNEQGLDLSRAHLFQLDEMLGVGRDDPRSFHAFLRKTLLDRIRRHPDRDHLLDGSRADSAAQIERHAQALQQLGGPDLVFLGLGPNGHVAFNEPGSRLEDGAREVGLDAVTQAALRSSFPDRPVPTRGITLGLAEIFSGRRIRLLVTDTSKAAILRDVLEREPGPDRPASLLLGHPDIAILADAAACSKLPASAESAASTEEPA